MSKIEVNEIVKASGSTLTLGGCGTAVTLGSGATQSGFGRTGTVDWQTGSVKTSTFTAANGEGYFANTTGGAFTMNLPSGSAGNIVSVADYAGTFQTNNLTVSPNGSQKINGVNANSTLNIEGQSVTFVYVDDTRGWKNVQDSQSNVSGASFIAATGGTITTVCTNFKVHTFTSPGTFQVTCAGSSAGANKISYLVVAGGAAGGFDRGGGGGAGGFRESIAPTCSYTQSPISASGGLPVAVASYPVVVGAGGSTSNSSCSPVPPGSNSVFSGTSTITATGGGGAGNPGGSNTTGKPGGSGGGARDGGGAGGNGNTPPVTPAQGQNGGSAPSNQSGPGGGGGGATEAGFDGSSNPSQPTMGDGGDGATTSINGSATAFAGGGGSGGGGSVPAGGQGGAGGGGKGADQPAPAPSVAGTTNRGGGGGAGNGSPSQNGAAGGSGIVIIRYKFQ